jgi:hypothetical protein
MAEMTWGISSRSQSKQLSVQCSISRIDTSGEYLIAACSSFAGRSPLLWSALHKQRVWRTSDVSIVTGMQPWL